MEYFNINPAQLNQVSRPKNQYFEQALEFCIEWQNGQTEFVRHTSGSTSEPKSIKLTRQQIQASIAMTQRALALNSDFCSLICLNVNYIAGTMMLARAMEIGMDMIVVEPSTNPLADIPTDLKIDFAAFVPLQMQTMIEAGLTDRLNNLKVIIVGGAAVSKTLNTAIHSLSVPVYSTYGMTETVSHVALQLLNTQNRSEFYSLLDGILADVDERKCLKICGTVTNNQWLQTNDIVEWQGERIFKIMGRADNIINSGGIKIQLEKVENAIGEVWNRVERYYCWWQADEQLGQALVLIVESPLLYFELPLGLDRYLSKYEIPKIVCTIAKFNETSTSKIDKKATYEAIKRQNY